MASSLLTVEADINKNKVNGNFQSADTAFNKQAVEYVGIGQDDAPKSPVKGKGKGHKKVSSKSSQKSLKGGNNTNHTTNTTDTSTHTSTNIIPLTKPAPPLYFPSSSSSSSSLSSPSYSEIPDIVYEGKSSNNGTNITSVKPAYDYDESLNLDKSEKRQDQDRSTLVSGRVPSAGWDSSGIRFAPLNVPFKRRLQTLIVLLHTLMMFILLSIFFFCCSNFLFWLILWPILFPYIIYVSFSNASTSGQMSHRSNWLRSQKVWSLFASYFPARLHRTNVLDPKRKYIFGYHPHGIISHGAWSAFATEALGFSHLFPGITNTLLTLNSNFRVPFYREYLLRMGLASVSRKSCKNQLTRGGDDHKGQGRAITIVIGGARESLETHPGTIRLVLECRKGFIKIAINTGADLVPVLCFGENDIYETVDSASRPWLSRAQQTIKKKFGFTAPMFHARGVFNYDVGMMPYRRPMNIVVGRPIKVEHRDEIDEDYVTELQKKYIDELMSIWETWKDDFAPDRKAELQIIA